MLVSDGHICARYIVDESGDVQEEKELEMGRSFKRGGCL